MATTTPRRTSTPIRVLSGSTLSSHAGRSQRPTVTPLTFLEDEALPILAEETAALHANLADMADIHQSLSTFNESFAAFLYGIKMNAFCVEWPEAPTDAHLQAWAARPAGPAQRARTPRSSTAPNELAADETYVTEMDADEPRARVSPDTGARTSRGPRRPAARPATERAPRAPPASSLSSSRTQAPRNKSSTTAPPVRQRVPPAVLKRRTTFADDIIDTMPLEYRQGDPKQRLLVQHIILALLAAGEAGVRAAELAQAPDRPLGKVNKALIALLAANHVVRVSNHGVVYRLNTQRHPVRP
ncbi:Similar to S.cerevisiae protein DAM1 (Essential subunit of the Dam1 complex (aka DASH complex)) [Malassezia sympodialis ATCC 42132]|uniref:DASH complex subunit DAM1 n=1 Tax=Malassezia sympodialis (strain ATCC 42132) TaxID=1230383 RepID=A0A1M8ABE9_MALS4|nr:Similar to S.cerevisiae protein DAM1 (Essential subunit of the Dam1 complex (aka DASH complex)) [Malassezia sympodialis ATCC 42132]